MARPLRIESAGALYHVTARGNERGAIFLRSIDDDRVAFLDVLWATCERFNWVCHAYCLMTNYYHLLVETADANLSKGMRLDYYASRYPDRDRALAEAYRTGAYSMQAIADHFGVSRMTVSRAVKRFEPSLMR